MRAALLVLALAACSGKSGGGSAAAAAAPRFDAGLVAADPAMQPYVDAIVPLIKLEREAFAAIADHTGEKYTDDDALLAALRAIAIPKYREFVDGLKGLPHPPGAKAGLHDRLVVLASAELVALEGLARALEKGDGNAVLEFNREQRRVTEAMDEVIGAWLAP
jgi:hypothetical protein